MHVQGSFVPQVASLGAFSCGAKGIVPSSDKFGHQEALAKGIMNEEDRDAAWKLFGVDGPMHPYPGTFLHNQRESAKRGIWETEADHIRIKRQQRNGSGRQEGGIIFKPYYDALGRAGVVFPEANHNS